MRELYDVVGAARRWPGRWPSDSRPTRSSDPLRSGNRRRSEGVAREEFARCDEMEDQRLDPPPARVPRTIVATRSGSVPGPGCGRTTSGHPPLSPRGCGRGGRRGAGLARGQDDAPVRPALSADGCACRTSDRAEKRNPARRGSSAKAGILGRGEDGRLEPQGRTAPGEDLQADREVLRGGRSHQERARQVADPSRGELRRPDQRRRRRRQGPGRGRAARRGRT